MAVRRVVGFFVKSVIYSSRFVIAGNWMMMAKLQSINAPQKWPRGSLF